MALNWNIEKCQKLEEVKQDWAVTETLIWLTMSVGMREITNANYKEFYARVHLVELLNGSFLYKEREPRYITLEDVKLRVGLRTNSSTKTRSQFNKTYLDRYYKETV